MPLVTFNPIPTPVYVSLWISLVVYGVVGLTYFFHDFVKTFNPPWVAKGWPSMMIGTWKSMAATGLVVLAYVCASALIAGEINTLEIEIELLSVSLYAGLVAKHSLPMPLTVIVPLTKPEVWLTLTLWITSWDLVRTPALILSIVFVLYGVAFAILKPYFSPFEIGALLEELQKIDPETAEKLAKMAPAKGAAQV